MPIVRPADVQPVGQFDFVGFNKKLGHRLTGWRPGFVELTMEIQPDLMNASGVVHGGVLMTLLDAASGLAASFEGPDRPRKFCRTLSFTTQFINPGRSGTLTVRGQKRGSGRSTFVCEAEIADEQGELVAVGTGTYRQIGKEGGGPTPAA
ncbi:MAG: PaaI family thioesterase [Alphaproteobacteria bacterium]|nr:PaaI family thioesterase [Alphaproteobacteria bacterium]